jgi:hypothetical protein
LRPLKKKPTKSPKFFLIGITHIGFDLTINLTKIPMGSTRIKVQNETKALIKTKTLGEGWKKKTP